MASRENPKSVATRLDAIEAQLAQIVQALFGGGGGTEGATAKVELSEDEIDGIGDALEALESKLTDRQRLYLLGIFGAAAHHLEQALSTEGTTLENLRTIQVTNAAEVGEVKLSDAFIGLTKVEHGRLGSLTGMGAAMQDSIGVGVGVGCVGVDWSKDLSKVDVGGWRTNPAFDTGRVGGSVINPGPLGGLPGGFGR